MRLRTRLFADYYVGGLLHVLLKLPTALLGRLLRRDHDLTRCRSVTVLKMLGGGSLVIAYPALLALRSSPRVTRLRLVTTPAVRPFAELLGVFDEIITIREDAPLPFLRDAAAALVRLFREDAIIDFEVHSRLTTAFSLLTCARNRVCFYTRSSFWRKGLATHLLFCNLANGIYAFYAQLPPLFGAERPDWDAAQRQFRARLGLQAARPPDGTFRIALTPYCSSLAQERMLRHEEWSAVLARRLARLPHGAVVQLHVLGAPSDAADMRRLAARLSADLPGARVEPHVGATLGDAVRLLGGCDEIASIDSALLHVARLIGLPAISFWGPSDPAMRLAPRPQADEVHYGKVTCSPCVHLAADPPCRGNNVCMRLAADPALPIDRNPAWPIVDDSRLPFFRLSDD